MPLAPESGERLDSCEAQPLGSKAVPACIECALQTPFRACPTQLLHRREKTPY